MQIKGQCIICGRNKSVNCTNSEIAGDGNLGNFFKKVWNKAVKPAGSYIGKNIAKDPMKALNMGFNMGAALALKNPTAIMSAGAQAGKFLATGKGIKRVGTIQGNGLYMRMK